MSQADSTRVTVITLFFAPCFFQVQILDQIFFKFQTVKKTGWPDKLEQWVQIDLASIVPVRNFTQNQETLI